MMGDQKIAPPPRTDANLEARLRENIRGEVRVEFRRYVVGVALVSLIVGGLIGVDVGAPEPTPPAAITPPARWAEGLTCSTVMTTDSGLSWTTTTPEPLQVYVSGAVAAARLVTVPAGSLVADAVTAVGGARPEADLDALNLAAPLSNHQHVYVPVRSERSVVPVGTSNVTEVSTPADQIDINTASVEELQTLPFIGAARAADIVAYRDAQGGFDTIEEIQAVPGIGPTIFERIAPLIRAEP